MIIGHRIIWDNLTRKSDIKKSSNTRECETKMSTEKDSNKPRTAPNNNSKLLKQSSRSSILQCRNTTAHETIALGKGLESFDHRHSSYDDIDDDEDLSCPEDEDFDEADELEDWHLPSDVGVAGLDIACALTAQFLSSKFEDLHQRAQVCTLTGFFGL